MRFSSGESHSPQGEALAVSVYFPPAQLEELEAKLQEARLHDTINLTKDDRGRPARIDALRTDSLTEDGFLNARQAASSGATSSRGFSPLPFQRPLTFVERVSQHQSELQFASEDATHSPSSVEINGDDLIMADVASVS
jgi:hypothetical protein